MRGSGGLCIFLYRDQVLGRDPFFLGDHFLLFFVSPGGRSLRFGGNPGTFEPGCFRFPGVVVGLFAFVIGLGCGDATRIAGLSLPD